jgi:NNP family nitrate/nitrite transporter-like MFS transporter
MCQYWTNRMFTKEVGGTANALVDGWGNLGGGVTQLVMGSA